MPENPSEKHVGGAERNGKYYSVGYKPQRERAQNHRNDIRSVLIRVRKSVPNLLKVVHSPVAHRVLKGKRKRTDIYVKPEYGKLQYG